jgi:cytochrome c oxidase cbb3-type subunit 3
MKRINKIKLFFFLLLNVLFVAGGFAQAAAPAVAPAAANTGINIPVNTMLFYIALILLFIIIILASAVNGAIDLYRKNKNDAATKATVVLLGFLFLSQFVFAQDATTTTATTDAAAAAAASAANSTATIYFYSFIAIIIIEIGIILFFIKSLRFLTGIDKAEEGEAKQRTLWEKFNNFGSLEDEAKLDVGHSYDGIRELDNATPSWFTITFAASIVIAIIYLYQFNISGSIPRQEDELAAEMRDAQKVQDELAKKEGNSIDENTVTMLGAADIASGTKLFAANCSPCHGDKGQGVVGPNLTDDYWLHGGSIKDVFKTIKYGFPDKGMKSWKDDFSAKQIAQIASYIESIHGTNPPGAKEKQGELYKADTAPATPEATADATKK